MAKTREGGCPGPYAAWRERKKKKQNNFITELQFTQSIYSTQKVGLTWFNTGDGEGFGTEVGPVIGCGGLFISRSFIRLH